MACLKAFVEAKRASQTEDKTPWDAVALKFEITRQTKRLKLAGLTPLAVMLTDEVHDQVCRSLGYLPAQTLEMWDGLPVFTVPKHPNRAYLSLVRSSKGRGGISILVGPG